MTRPKYSRQRELREFDEWLQHQRFRVHAITEASGNRVRRAVVASMHRKAESEETIRIYNQRRMHSMGPARSPLWRIERDSG